MEINENNFERLASYLQQTLSPDPEVRRPGEYTGEILKGHEKV